MPESYEYNDDLNIPRVHIDVLNLTIDLFDNPPGKGYMEAIIKDTIFGEATSYTVPLEGAVAFASVCVGRYSASFMYPDGSMEHLIWIGDTWVFHQHGDSEYYEKGGSEMGLVISELIFREPELVTVQALLSRLDNVEQVKTLFDGICVSCKALSYSAAISATWLIACMSTVSDDMAEAIHTHVNNFTIEDLGIDWASEKFSYAFMPTMTDD